MDDAPTRHTDARVHHHSHRQPNQLCHIHSYAAAQTSSIVPNKCELYPSNRALANGLDKH